MTLPTFGVVLSGLALLLPWFTGESAAAEAPDSVATGGELPSPALTEVWEPVPPLVEVPSTGVPSDAIVLFGGDNLDGWESVRGGPAGWRIDGAAMIVRPGSGDIRTKASFGDVQLHLEFRAPTPAVGDGQDRGNSGVSFMGRYEVQIMDSFENRTYVNGQAAAVYKQYPPLVNASRPPGMWQSYDIVFIAPRFAAGGTMRSPARMTVLHNGVLVQHDVKLKGPTEYRGYPTYRPHPSRLPIELEEHRQPVEFRNIWVRDLAPPGVSSPSRREH